MCQCDTRIRDLEIEVEAKRMMIEHLEKKCGALEQQVKVKDGDLEWTKMQLRKTGFEFYDEIEGEE